MLRRLYPDQPDSFAFTEANREWAQAQIRKYPEGRQASAIIPLLWRAQEQEGWLSRPAIEHVAAMLDMAYIRALEVATFYFMFQLQPVGEKAHVQVCGTTSCMICGAEDLIAVCKEKIAPKPHQIGADGALSWEEVECLGACANAPMIQVGKDYYEDLTAESFAALLDAFAQGEAPQPGSQTGRFASEPAMGLTSLDGDKAHDLSASAHLAATFGDTIKRIDGTEQPLGDAPRQPVPDGAAHPERDPLTGPGAGPASADKAGSGAAEDKGPDLSEGAPADETGASKLEADAEGTGRPRESEPAEKAQDASPTTAGDDPRVGRQEQISEEPTVSETKPADAGPVAEGLTGRDAPAGSETRGGVATGNVAAQDGGAVVGDDSSSARAETVEAPSSSSGQDAAGEGTKPQALDAPDGEPDDLKQIRGVGPKLESLLHSLGIFHFRQIAAWGPSEVAWMDANLEGFRGRVSRDAWVDQAADLASGGETEFSSRVKRGDIYD